VLRVLLFSLIIPLSLTSFAHEIRFSELKGNALCLDQDSIQVSIKETTNSLDAGQLSTIQTELKRLLPTVLNRYEVPFKEKASCRPNDTYIYLLYSSSWGEDTNGLPYLVQANIIQVGRKNTPVIASPEYLVNKLEFENYYSAFLFEDEITPPLHAGMLEISQEMIEELSVAWWDAYTVIQENRQAWQQSNLRYAVAISVAATILIIVLGVFIRQKRRNQPKLSVVNND